MLNTLCVPRRSCGAHCVPATAHSKASCRLAVVVVDDACMGLCMVFFPIVVVFYVVRMKFVERQVFTSPGGRSFK